MRPNVPPEPPAGISPEAADWWRRIVAEYSVNDEAGKLLLQTALEAFDRMRGAQQIIEHDGATVLDRFGQAKAHPLLTVERDSRAQMLAALKALHFDVEPLRDKPGRPGGT